MAKAYKKYKKKYDFSYTFGTFATIELILNKPDKVLQVFITEAFEKSDSSDKLKSICAKEDIQISISEKVISRIADKGSIDAVGVFRKYKTELVEGESNVVLYQPSDSGNLGTIIRTALGFGLKNIGLVTPCVDVFYPSVIRASMGSIFRINIELFDDIRSAPLHDNCYLFYTDGDEKLPEVKFDEPFTLVFGSEGPGLPDRFRSLGQTVRIPYNDKTIDSFNLSVSTAIAFYEATKNTKLGR